MNHTEACEAAAKAFESSAAAMRSQSKTTHAVASAAHKTVAAAFNEIPTAYRNEGIHSKLSAFHDDETQEAPEGQIQDRLAAKAKSYGELHGIKDQAKAMESWLRTPEGNREWEAYRNSIVLGRGR